MPQTAKNNELKDAYKRAQADIASLADWIECELDKTEDKEPTWPGLGDLQHVRKNLIETLAFFSGFPEAEIQCSLDEMQA
ncbi:MAG: hypothetical protein ACOCZE_13315 [Planctomycetota bacterium]